MKRLFFLLFDVGKDNKWEPNETKLQIWLSNSVKTRLDKAVESTDRIIIDNSSNFIGKGDDNWDNQVSKYYRG